MSVPPESASTPPPPPSSESGTPSAEERQWAMFAHLSALIGGLLSSTHFGLAVFVGPLVIWLLKKDTMPFVNDQGKEALNFNITVAIVGLGLLVLSVLTIGIGLVIAIPAWIVIGIGWLVLTIIAAIRSNNGERYRYPFSWRLIH